jgi:hypothetical protein
MAPKVEVPSATTKELGEMGYRNRYWGPPLEPTGLFDKTRESFDLFDSGPLVRFRSDDVFILFNSILSFIELIFSECRSARVNVQPSRPPELPRRQAKVALSQVHKDLTQPHIEAFLSALTCR